VKALGVIPARLHSTRLPSKPLFPILSRPLVQWVYEAASQSRSLDRLTVATDSVQIAEAVEQFGGEVLITSKEHTSGTDRVAEVARNSGHEIVLNIQGDEPLLQPVSLDRVVDAIIQNEDVQIATLVTRCRQEELDNPNVVKVVCGKDDSALYFSRAAIPYFRDGEGYHYKHIGVYGFRRDALLRLSNLPASRLEQAEGLEQLRALEYNYRIRVVFTPYWTTGVDTREDVHKVEKILKEGRWRENQGT
jgi:3-deoxy-manno-octulosonate cytidylyltransferase (CMP-KDO synthetase)